MESYVTPGTSIGSFRHYIFLINSRIQLLFMGGNTTDTDWEDFDFTDHNDRNLITDISAALACISGENRAKRRKQKIREELVREQIENQQQPTPFIWSWPNRWRDFISATRKTK